MAFRVVRTLGGWTVIPYDQNGDRPPLFDHVRHYDDAWELLDEAWLAQLDDYMAAA